MLDGLTTCDPWEVERCVRFVLAETQGVWHNRARAKMCRRLKHCALGRTHREQLVACILGRLRDGHFTEQYRDQLRLAPRLDRPAAEAAAHAGMAADKAHVRRYSAWLLARAGDMA